MIERGAGRRERLAEGFEQPRRIPEREATLELEKEKAEQVLDEIVARSHVKVPDTYTVKPPDQQPMQSMPPGLSRKSAWKPKFSSLPPGGPT